MRFEHVKGENKGDIILYALSTCIWCKKTKGLLDKIGCSYKYVYVDLLNENDKETVRKKIIKWNPRISFPTMIIDEKKCIIGYKEEEIKDALNI